MVKSANCSANSSGELGGAPASRTDVFWAPGGPSLMSSSESPTTLALVFVESLRDPARFVFEPDARNTHENASLSLELVGSEAGDVWLLVTSAQHMPRAVGVFRKIGWDVIPCPVDHQVSSVAPWAAWPDVALNLTRIDGGIKEWAGLLVYYLLDRSSEFFPGPDTPHQTNQA